MAGAGRHLALGTSTHTEQQRAPEARVQYSHIPNHCGDLHTRTYIHTYVRTYIHTYVHTYVHTYIRTYMHTFIHTYVHTYIRELSGSLPCLPLKSKFTYMYPS